MVLPDALTTIASQAFRSNRLTSVEIPAGVTTLGDDAFASNPDLTRVRFSRPDPAVITGADASARAHERLEAGGTRGRLVIDFTR